MALDAITAKARATDGRFGMQISSFFWLRLAQ
jgi:hypothetical protein